MSNNNEDSATSNLLPLEPKERNTLPIISESLRYRQILLITALSSTISRLTTSKEMKTFES